MDRDPVVYLDGRYLPRSAAMLSVEDRGTLFGDGVYEVVRYYGGRPFALAAHRQRLQRSLEGICLTPPPDAGRLGEISEELLSRNGWSDARAYWQITRGAAPRELPFPTRTRPSVLVMAHPLEVLDPAAALPRWRAVLAEDTRWRDCWIKSLMLLPNLLAHNRALEAGADAAIFQRDGVLTEATNANFFAVRSGALWTHPSDGRILGGVTRDAVIGLAREMGIEVREQGVHTEELPAIDEAFLTGTTTHVAPIVSIDGQTVGDGGAGSITRRLHEAFAAYVQAECGTGAVA